MTLFERGVGTNKHKQYTDLLPVAKFIKENYDIGGEYLRPSAEDLLDSTLTIYVALDEEGIVATTSFRQVTPNLVNLERTIVRKNSRGKGIGKQISISLETIIKEKGYNKMTCQIYTTNLQMLTLRLKQGFLVEGLLKDHDELGVHEYLLGKVL